MQLISTFIHISISVSIFISVLRPMSISMYTYVSISKPISIYCPVSSFLSSSISSSISISSSVLKPLVERFLRWRLWRRGLDPVRAVGEQTRWRGFKLRRFAHAPTSPSCLPTPPRPRPPPVEFCGRRRRRPTSCDRHLGRISRLIVRATVVPRARWQDCAPPLPRALPGCK